MIEQHDMSSTASKTPLQDPPTDKIAPVSCTLITILVSLNLLWEGVYCHELTSNLEIICDLYVQAHPKRDYKTKLLSCESYFLPHWMMLQRAVTRKSSTYNPVRL